MPQIHPSAIIESGAELHDDVSVGPFSIIESGAVIEQGCRIESQVRIYAQTRMGRDNTICHGATIGCVPQDLSYAAEQAKPLVIGNGNTFREYANVSHGIKEDQGTRIGDNNFLMAYSHVGHDCLVGDHNILANSATLSGHVRLGNRCFLSGQVAVHQFCQIGDYVMVGGLSGVNQDVPPFVLVNGQRAKFLGINVVGLRRAGFSPQARKSIKRAYRSLFQSGKPMGETLQELRTFEDDEAIAQIVRFIDDSKRGIISAG